MLRIKPIASLSFKLWRFCLRNVGSCKAFRNIFGQVTGPSSEPKAPGGSPPELCLTQIHSLLHHMFPVYILTEPFLTIGRFRDCGSPSPSQTACLTRMRNIWLSGSIGGGDSMCACTVVWHRWWEAVLQNVIHSAPN